MKNKINEFYISMICLVFLLWNYSMDRENTFIIKKIIEKINVSPKEKERLERQFHDNVIFNTKIQKELENEILLYSIEFVDREGESKRNTFQQDDQYKKSDGSKNTDNNGDSKNTDNNGGSNNTDNNGGSKNTDNNSGSNYDVEEYERMKYVIDYLNAKIEEENAEIDSEIKSLKLKIEEEKKKWIFRDKKYIAGLEKQIELLERKKEGSLST